MRFIIAVVLSLAFGGGAYQWLGASELAKFGALFRQVEG